MLTNKARKSLNIKDIYNETGVSESLIKQVNYLQNAIGNKEVETLINNGIINKDTSLDPESNIIADEKKKDEYEAIQIKKDREELREEVAQKVWDKKDEADSLLIGAPGAPLYVNVRTNLVYAEIPGTRSSLFYHYTDLVDIKFSFHDINLKGQPRRTKRGEIIPVEYSFKYEPVDNEYKGEDDRELEEQSVKEEKPGKEKSPPVEKKGAAKKKKEEISTTIINTQNNIIKDS